jgi:acetylornithine/succinyldiaminopimelate/putrescine aminotransferase
MEFTQVCRSLTDMAGASYVDGACRARAFLTGEPLGRLQSLAREPVDLWPSAMQSRLHALLPRVGQRVIEPVQGSARGGSTRAFTAATRLAAAPLAGFGWYRVGEDGRLCVISKSEHYHVALGHSFPGYGLIERARALGIPNATHNNTRGHLTRLLEEELLTAANSGGGGLDCVLNLETGSLALEAALKLVLARFHPHAEGVAAPPYHGRVPVILVIGDDDGGLTANYHGTTVLTQTMRGLWPTLSVGLERAGLFRVRAVRPNCSADLERAFREENTGECRVAALFHEIVMMNYGARVLSEAFLQHAYALCREHDAVTVVDEIQSCAWYEGGFLLRPYGIEPDMVALGKGFPGGEYPASRLLFRSRFDVLPQFGALVTNGQEELSSLACLITLTWLRANGAAITANGQLIEQNLRHLSQAFPHVLEGVEGRGHLLGLRFRDLSRGRAFAERLNEAGYDLSVQTYKATCPPVALCKLPIIADDALIEAFTAACREALEKAD